MTPARNAGNWGDGAHPSRNVSTHEDRDALRGSHGGPHGRSHTRGGCVRCGRGREGRTSVHGGQGPREGNPRRWRHGRGARRDLWRRGLWRGRRSRGSRARDRHWGGRGRREGYARTSRGRGRRGQGGGTRWPRLGSHGRPSGGWGTGSRRCLGSPRGARRCGGGCRPLGARWWCGPWRSTPPPTPHLLPDELLFGLQEPFLPPGQGIILQVLHNLPHPTHLRGAQSVAHLLNHAQGRAGQQKPGLPGPVRPGEAAQEGGQAPETTLYLTLGSG